MSRLLKKVENEAAVLRRDLKLLQSARMMNDPEFLQMYTAALEHHRHLKLSHLSGKSDDIIQKLVTDTYLYAVLTKMLMEVETRIGEDTHDIAFEQVKTWYRANSHKLTSRPKFSAKRDLPTPHLINISIPSPRPPNTTPTKKKTVVFPSQKSALQSKRSSLIGQSTENTTEPAVNETKQSPIKESSVTTDSKATLTNQSDNHSRKDTHSLATDSKGSFETCASKKSDDKEAIQMQLTSENEFEIAVNGPLLDGLSPMVYDHSEHEEHSRFPTNTPATDFLEGEEEQTKTENSKRESGKQSEEKKSVHPISSYVTPFQQTEFSSRNPKAEVTPGKLSARFQNTPSLRTVHLVLQQHSYGAQYQLWREEDELTLRERRIQGEIAVPEAHDWQDLIKKKDGEMDSLGNAKPEFAAYDTETFLRHTEGYYPLHTEKPSRLTSAQSRSKQEEVFIKEAIQALSDVSTDMMSNQRKEMNNVRWDERIEPIRLISHLACPPSRESQYHGPESNNLLLLDENLEPEANRIFLLENAADWRGKVTPTSAPYCRPKSPFSRHTFVKRLLRQRNRQQSQRVRPLSAPAPPANTSSPLPCAPSVPDTGRCTPPNLKSGLMDDAVRVQHLGGTGEDPWEAWMRRMRSMRRHPIRKGLAQTETPMSTEFISIITPATALGVFGVVDNVSSGEAFQHQSEDSGQAAPNFLQGSFGDSQTAILVPDSTPNNLSYADMEQIIRTHSARPTSASQQQKKAPLPSSRRTSNMPRTAPSIPSGRDYGTLGDLSGTGSSDNFNQTKYRLPKYTSVHPTATKTVSRPNSSKRETKGSLSVVGLTVNTKSELQRVRDESRVKIASPEVSSVKD